MRAIAAMLNPMRITHLNPDGLLKSPAFSQGVLVEGGKTVYVGGQNGVRADGTVVEGGFAAQIGQAYANVLAVLRAAGAAQENVVKMTVYVQKDQDPREGFAVARKVWGDFPTAISIVMVESVGPPGSLLEIEAVAAVEA